MNRRQLLSIVSGGFTTSLLSACENNFPSTPTVVTGKVVDENELPLEGEEVVFLGAKHKGLGALSTFRISQKTDKDGKFLLSYVVPVGTHWVEVLVETRYFLYVERNGQYEGAGAPPKVHSDDYGKTTTVNFQIKER